MFKPVWGELRECSPTPWQQQPTACPQHSLPAPGQKPTCMRASQRMGQWDVAPVPLLNPDPIAHLVGHSNEAPVIVDWQRVTTLINSGAQVSSITSQFYEDLTLQIQPLGRLLELEGTGGSAIPYLGYVDANLQILRIKKYNEDILLLVIPTRTYSEKVVVMVRSKIIDWVMGVITKGELAKVPWPGDRLILGLSCPGHYRCPILAQMELGWKNRWSIPPQGLTPWGWKSSAWMLPGPGLHYTEGNYSPIQYCQYTQKYQCPVTQYAGSHAGRANTRPQLPTLVVPMATYGELHLESSWVPICLWNLSAHSVEIPTKVVVGKVVPANQVQLVVLLEETLGVYLQPPKRVALGGPGPPRPKGMAQSWARTGQGAAA